MTHLNSGKPIILLAFANDAEAPLRELALEQDELVAVLDQGRRDGKYQIITLAAATPEKIVKAFQQYNDSIKIFHYGGHSNQESLFLRQDFPTQNKTKAIHLAEFLGVQSTLELIFINGCLSAEQAKSYTSHGAKAVIVTDRTIGDKAAREFASLFYQSLLGGATVSKSFQSAEKGYKTAYGDLPRGQGLQKIGIDCPWLLFPETTHYWRLPLLAKNLTFIPTIDLEKEFFGRQADMQRLKGKLENTSKVVLMNGLGGIGKTALATAYVKLYGDNYDHVAWISRGEDLITSIALNEHLADTLGLPFEQEEELAARFRRVLRMLHQLPGQNLLVIDNAQEQVAQKEIYEQLPSSPNWKVLLTSRLRLEGFDRLPLDTLAPASARILFRTHFQGEYKTEELEALLKEVSYHTLTVELLAKLLDKLNNVLTVAELTTLLQQKQLNDPDLQEKIWARYSGAERGIYLHLMKAFELTELTEREIWLLKQFAILPVEGYAVTTLADFLQKKPLRLNKTLNGLAKKGWLVLHENKTFSIHRLIRQMAEYRLQPSLSDGEILVDSMAQKMSVDDYTSRLIANVPWLNYATAVESYFTTHQTDKIAVLQNRIALTYGGLGQHETALSYHQKALVIRTITLDENHAGLASSYNNIALCYNDLGQYKVALTYHQKAQAIWETVLDENHPELAKAYNNIALCHNNLGQYETALTYYQKAQAIWELVLDGNHPELAKVYSNIGVNYRFLESYEKALDYQQKACMIRESVLDHHHPDLAQSYNNIALNYNALGWHEEALGFHQKAQAILEFVLDVNHPTLATSYNNIAHTYRSLGKYEEALEYHQKDLAILESVLSSNHPDLAAAYNNLAMTYRVLEQYKEALVYHQKAQVIFELVLDANHPYLATCYENIAGTYGKLGNKSKTEEYREKAAAIRVKEV